MKMAVPGTRVALFLADFAKISIGNATSVIRSRINLRPRAHVVSNVNVIRPTTSGNQPPCGTFIRFAAKYAPSTIRNSSTTGMASHHFHFHTPISKTPIRSVSIVTAPVTAIP